MQIQPLQQQINRAPAVSGSVRTVGGDALREIFSYLPPEEQRAFRIVSRETVNELSVSKREAFFREIVIEHGWDKEKWPEIIRDTLEIVGKKVGSLDLKGLEISKDKAALLLRFFPNLEKADFTEAHIEDGAIDQLKGFTKLKKLILKGATIRHLPSFKDVPLEYLDLSEADSWDANSFCFDHIPTLKVLKIRNAPFVQGKREIIAKNPQLEEVWGISLKRGEAPYPLTKARVLAFDHAYIESFDFLKKSPCLERFVVHCCSLASQAAWKNFPRLCSLRELEVDEGEQRGLQNRLTSLSPLEINWQLRKVTLSNCTSIDREAFNEFPFMPNLSALSIPGTQLHSLFPLRQNPLLEEVNLNQCTNITRNEFSQFPHMRRLKKLLLEATFIENIEALCRCQALQELSLSFVRRVQNFTPIERLKALKKIDVSHTPIRTEELVHVLPKKIEELNVKRCPNVVLDAANFPYLSELRVLKISEKGLYDARAITQQRSLRELELRYALRHERRLQNEDVLFQEMPLLKKLECRLFPGLASYLERDKKLSHLSVTYSHVDQIRESLPLERLFCLQSFALHNLQGGRITASRKGIEKVAKEMKDIVASESVVSSSGLKYVSLLVASVAFSICVASATHLVAPIYFAGTSLTETSLFTALALPMGMAYSNSTLLHRRKDLPRLLDTRKKR